MSRGNGRTHRPSRQETKCVRRSSELAGIESLELLKEELPPLPENTPVIIAYDQPVLDLLTKAGSRETTLIYAEHPSTQEVQAFHGFLVSEDMAQFLCRRCYEGLCQCSDKWQAPLVLGRITRGRFARVLHRTELPVEIPQAV